MQKIRNRNAQSRRVKRKLHDTKIRRSRSDWRRKLRRLDTDYGQLTEEDDTTITSKPNRETRHTYRKHVYETDKTRRRSETKHKQTGS